MKLFTIFFPLLLSINHAFAAEDPYHTSIDKIKEKLSAAPTKRLVIGGLHQEPRDMIKGLWEIAMPDDIVINWDETAHPDIQINGFDENLSTELAALGDLIQSHPNLKFDEIIFEHVGSGFNLQDLLGSELKPLLFLNAMLAAGGKFIHQSFYMAMDIKPARVFEVQTFRFQFKVLSSAIEENLTPESPKLFIDPSCYRTYFSPNSVLLQYIKALETVLGYINIQLSIETPPVNAPFKTFSFNIQAILPPISKL